MPRTNSVAVIILVLVVAFLVLNTYFVAFRSPVTFTTYTTFQNETQTVFLVQTTTQSLTATISHLPLLTSRPFSMDNPFIIDNGTTELIVPIFLSATTGNISLYVNFTGGNSCACDFLSNGNVSMKMALSNGSQQVQSFNLTDSLPALSDLAGILSFYYQSGYVRVVATTETSALLVYDLPVFTYNKTVYFTLIFPHTCNEQPLWVTGKNASLENLNMTTIESQYGHQFILWGCGAGRPFIATIVGFSGMNFTQVAVRYNATSIG